MKLEPFSVRKPTKPEVLDLLHGPAATGSTPFPASGGRATPSRSVISGTSGGRSVATPAVLTADRKLQLELFEGELDVSLDIFLQLHPGVIRELADPPGEDGELVDAVESLRPFVDP